MCIKLVIKTNLYYDARSEKHQNVPTVRMFLVENEKYCLVSDPYSLKRAKQL
jgi:hypothetical protein